MWGRKKSKPDSKQPDRIRDLADSLGRAGRLPDLEPKLMEFNIRKLEAHELVSWHVLWIAAAFRRSDRPEALKRAREAKRDLPNAPEIAFALGQELEFVGEIQKMVSEFRRLVFPEVSATHIMAAARYCYLRGEWDLGVGLAQQLLEACFALGCADDTFLWLRGLPFIAEPTATLIVFLVLKGEFSATHTLLDRIKSDLADCDLSHFKPIITAYERNDLRLTSLPDHSEKPLSAPVARFERLQQAVWDARTASSVSGAESLLEAAVVTSEDFQWLPDVKLLSRAETRRRSWT